MSKVILHPVPHSRQLQAYELPEIAQKEREKFENMAHTAIELLKGYLSDGYTLIDSWDDTHGMYNIRQFLLFKSDEVGVVLHNVQSVVLTSISPQSSYSKTEKTDFDWFRCGFAGNKTVNIFDHPDKSRNTWNNVLHRGWTWQSFQDAIYNRYPVPVTVSYDGEWYSLVEVVDYHEYNEMCEIIDTLNGAKDNDDDNN